ncbi:PRP38-domain-containing protein [Epithele typhae]|uniref:PRP38-domain-containing protein n=1 Tax=Epithele typhae TaxID=378194 RepID=UPI0020087AB3|nr:PRP38-domain-containing protein [Epithele typhae]KAH9946377.1 PRP38-domain-containing protein [Epithele typhae]
MANTTVRGATAIHGQNPQYLVESHCFALTGHRGVYGNQKPTEFLCLLLKLLQIQPEKEILIEYLRADEFKYLRALAVFYIRMTFRPAEVYEILEPLLKDYRKLRYLGMGGYTLTYMDEFVDQLLNEERVCDLILPRMTKRDVLEDAGDIGPRKSRLLDAMEGKSEHGSERGRSRAGAGAEARTGAGRDGQALRRSPRAIVEAQRHRSGSRSPYRSRSRSISPDRRDGSAGGSPARSPSR